MRVWCRHTPTEVLIAQRPSAVNGNHPTMKVGFRFCQQNGQTRALQEWWGLVDSGAGMTAVPASCIGQCCGLYPGDLFDPMSTTLIGLHAQRSVPSYLAILSVYDQFLDGPFCPGCGERLTDQRNCPTGCKTPAAGAFLIAAIPDLGFPSIGRAPEKFLTSENNSVKMTVLIGRDVSEKFLTIINPFARQKQEKYTAFANGKDGRMLAQCLKLLRGHCLSPRQTGDATKGKRSVL